MRFVRTIRTEEFIAASAPTAAAEAASGSRNFHVGVGFRFQFRFDPLEGFADVGRLHCVPVAIFPTKLDELMAVNHL